MKTTRTLPVQALLVVGLLSACLHAQSVGIGTSNPHSSARLHIEDNARGLLIPNVALNGTNDVTTVSGPATSLLVYNTATTTGPTAVLPGFYYWDGSQWVRLLGGGEAWLLTGNAGTNPAVNFLGTTDNQPLVIRVNNQETFRFNPPGTSAPAWSIQRGGGNQRGLHAVDLQSSRSGVTQVASGDHSVIGGGRANTASGFRATVGGGFLNTASGDDATVGGGSFNTASGGGATVSGGSSNNASGLAATVGGGSFNTASSTYATVGGGQTNTVSGNSATVGGGYLNNASGDFATLGGGWQNTASGGTATVGGGWQNFASGGGATVGGGYNNTASAQHATVGGGLINTANGNGATIGGGSSNNASGIGATIGGGYTNTASGLWATVGGGRDNTASGVLATVGGGDQNTASGDYATVGGGWQNFASGGGATVGGGFQNTASGNYSVVPGGRGNNSNGAYNLVFGENVDPSVTETHRVYFFGDGSGSNPSGFLVINRLDGDHPIHVGTNGTNGNGAHLTTGGQWMPGSSRSFKERFVQYRPAEVLEKILQLPVEGYFYKGTEEYHITPMAEDFYRLFGTGVHEIIETDSTGQLVRRPNPDVDKYLAASDVAGVALLGVQALHEENAQLRQQVFDMRAEDAQLRQQVSDMRMEDAQLRQRVSDLERENAALRARLEQLEAFVHKIASTQTSP